MITCVYMIYVYIPYTCIHICTHHNCCRGSWDRHEYSWQFYAGASASHSGALKKKKWLINDWHICQLSLISACQPPGHHLHENDLFISTVSKILGVVVACRSNLWSQVQCSNLEIDKLSAMWSPHCDLWQIFQ